MTLVTINALAEVSLNEDETIVEYELHNPAEDEFIFDISFKSKLPDSAYDIIEIPIELLPLETKTVRINYHTKDLLDFSNKIRDTNLIGEIMTSYEYKVKRTLKI